MLAVTCTMTIVWDGWMYNSTLTYVYMHVQPPSLHVGLACIKGDTNRMRCDGWNSL